MLAPVKRVLFLCTGNSARSIIAEALMNKLGGSRFQAYSAGSMPNGSVKPQALRFAESLGFSPTEFRSKSWDEFAHAGAPKFDFILTVCDNAAGEVCPIWPGQPMTAHWGIPDPAAVQGTDIEKKAAFNQAFKSMDRRIKLFLSLPIASLDQLRIKQEMDTIGKTALTESSE